MWVVAATKSYSTIESSIVNMTNYRLAQMRNTNFWSNVFVPIYNSTKITVQPFSPFTGNGNKKKKFEDNMMHSKSTRHEIKSLSWLSKERNPQTHFFFALDTLLKNNFFFFFENFNQIISFFSPFFPISTKKLTEPHLHAVKGLHIWKFTVCCVHRKSTVKRMKNK